MEANSALLVVDDDMDVLRAARIALTSHVECVELATSVEDMEARIASRPFEAVLLDMNFEVGARNGAAGMGALTRVQVLDPNLAVVLMTAYGSLTLAVDALKQGAADFILKPWRNEKIITAVIAAMSITRNRRTGATLDLESLERRAIERALAQHNGNISLAASTLGLSRPALYRRMSKYGFLR